MEVGSDWGRLPLSRGLRKERREEASGEEGGRGKGTAGTHKWKEALVAQAWQLMAGRE